MFDSHPVFRLMGLFCVKAQVELYEFQLPELCVDIAQLARDALEAGGAGDTNQIRDRIAHIRGDLPRTATPWRGLVLEIHHAANTP